MLARREDFAQNRALICDQGAEVTPINLDGVIRDGRHHMQVRVYYEDTDFALTS